MHYALLQTFCCLVFEQVFLAYIVNSRLNNTETSNNKEQSGKELLCTFHKRHDRFHTRRESFWPHMENYNRDPYQYNFGKHTKVIFNSWCNVRANSCPLRTLFFFFTLAFSGVEWSLSAVWEFF